ncbi:MAG: threonine synthase [Planctomycetes bacterium]|jgi:threonine synthase|nr:threonine synthase [Planctomycetota bacterium]
MPTALAVGLKCRECGHEYADAPKNVCEHDFAPLEVNYDYDAIKKSLTREAIAKRTFNMWRYKELLPEQEPVSGLTTGGTPLVHAKNLGRELGVKNLYVKFDGVCQPTLSFKDRVVAVSIARAKRFGFTTVGCASTGNLANSVAAQAAQAGLKAIILIPKDLEPAKVANTQIYGATLVKIDGPYDDVNRLCSEIANDAKIGIVNVNLRPYYAEGSKSMGFEIAEQLGWRAPDNIICPMAGGSLINKLSKSFKEFEKLGLLEAAPKTKFWGAQAAGCNPITDAIKRKSDLIKPVKKPDTIARSIAIGNPADGYFAARLCLDTGGGGDDITDAEIIEAMKLLARTEGLFTETAGGVTLGVFVKLLKAGRINKDESTVVCITGQGLKTLDPLYAPGVLPDAPVIKPTLAAFKDLKIA